MARKDPRVDAYIEKAAKFAKPILKQFRRVVHATCPAVEEGIKWGVPHFDYKGMMCGMAAFNEHCAIGFWKGELVFDGKANREAMGHFGRVTSLKQLPPDAELADYIRKAMKLNDEGVPAPHVERRTQREPLPVPADLRTALQKNKQAQATFKSFSPSHRREYIEWITEAKTDATRTRRLATAIEWLAEGKPRNWKYAR